MNKDTENAINYFKYRTSFETSVFETTQFQTIIKALTPPTAEEVCEALGETFEINVKYEKETKTFKFVCGGNIIYPSAYKNQKNKIVINSVAIPPHLITLIGRFYESVVK